MEITNGDRIFKFLQKCQRNHYKDDLHSFVIDIDGGIAFVDCRGYDEVFIEARIYGDGFEKVNQWCGTTIAAANRLERLGGDYRTMDM